MEDIRYSEFLFLQALASRKIELFNNCDGGMQASRVRISPLLYSEMAAALIEDLYVRFERSDIQSIISKLRGELFPPYSSAPAGFSDWQWANPRQTILDILSQNSLQTLRITYRGVRRIEELRDLLKRDRILEDFGVLLSIRYFRRDLEDALMRDASVSVSVLYADMDDFGTINKQHGQAAGDVVMKTYLEIFRDCLGSLGTGYRGVGDETCALILGQGHEHAVQIAETIRKRVESMRCVYEEVVLPKVTASMGIATSPPLQRTMDIETSSQDRQRRAKQNGKNRVIVE